MLLPTLATQKRVATSTPSDLTAVLQKVMNDVYHI